MLEINKHITEDILMIKNNRVSYYTWEDKKNRVFEFMSKRIMYNLRRFSSDKILFSYPCNSEYKEVVGHLSAHPKTSIKDENVPVQGMSYGGSLDKLFYGIRIRFDLMDILNNRFDYDHLCSKVANAILETAYSGSKIDIREIVIREEDREDSTYGIINITF